VVVGFLHRTHGIAHQAVCLLAQQHAQQHARQPPAAPCREAGSTDMDLDTLVTVQVALATASSTSNHAEHYTPLHAACEALVGWLGGVANNAQLMRPQGFERFEVVWSNQQVSREGGAGAQQRAWGGWRSAAALVAWEALPSTLLPAAAGSWRAPR
jgi:hypothetical protein